MLFLGLALLAAPALAHMEMTFPAPFRSKYNTYVSEPNRDYSMTSPLLADGSNYPCKGYQSDFTTAEGASTATFSQGGTYNFTVVGTAIHGGGSCQASLSYDGGNTFTVVQSIEGNCPVSGSGNFDFTVPSDAPSGDAVFAWTWFNNIGNREMYMNCAHVTIAGSSAAKRSSGAAFSSRPANFIANVNNGCSTVANMDVIFPSPGPDLLSQSTGATSAPEGTCGAVGSSSSGSTSSSSSAAAVESATTSVNNNNLVATSGSAEAAVSASSTDAAAVPTDTSAAAVTSAAVPATTSSSGTKKCNKKRKIKRAMTAEAKAKRDALNMTERAAEPEPVAPIARPNMLYVSKRDAALKRHVRRIGNKEGKRRHEFSV
ncbi:uncharacterized protein EHS24_003870 [Apiotrichum porosum]|uniref:Chitin-binding type-4 domain-containing protein n=1 Tax=Apiotrichum porosum TaxID=105984 RepID=A0A427XDT5_9TREE|nr:uncharacterized protein EHS24_003870 [Apiotrichum porosum]RSH76933.1 hypothetical protein EHS24_003870 [Apiotrichum porosum]